MQTKSNVIALPKSKTKKRRKRRFLGARTPKGGKRVPFAAIEVVVQEKGLDTRDLNELGITKAIYARYKRIGFVPRIVLYAIKNYGESSAFLIRGEKKNLAVLQSVAEGLGLSVTKV